MVAGADLPLLSGAQADFLLEAGEDPDKWYAPDPSTLVPRPREGQCSSVLVQRCQRGKHTGNHTASYFALGGLMNTDVWGENVKRATGKESM